jgi:hypothetical protein
VLAALLAVLAVLAAAMLTWMFRRIVVLFALLEAAERIEENAPGGPPTARGGST